MWWGGSPPPYFPLGGVDVPGGRVSSDSSESSSAEQTLLEAWVPLAASFLGICTAFSMSAMIGPMLVPLGSEFGMSVPALGQLATLTFLPWGVSASLIGPISDRYGRKRILLIGLAGLSISGAAAAAAPDYLTLAACRVLTGACGGFVPPSCLAALTDQFTGRRRGHAIAIGSTGYSTSWLVALPLVALLTGRYGWRSTFLLAAIFSAGTFLLMIAIFPPGKKRESPKSYLSSFAWMRSAGPWYGIGANMFERLMIAVFITYVSAFMIRRYGVSMAALAWILTAITAGNLFGSLAGGFLMGRSWRYAGLVAVLLIEGTALAWKFAAEPALPAAMAAGFLFSFLTGMSRSTLVDTLSNFAPHDRGTIIGVFATSNQVGFVLGASLGGLAIAWGGYGALGAICLAAGAGGAAFYLRLGSWVSDIR